MTFESWLANVVLRKQRQPTSPSPDMTGITTDHNNPALGHGWDDEPVPQNEKYLVLSEEERSKGFVRPVRRKYIHLTCGGVTSMGQTIAETYARDPKFYGSTYCVHCKMHRPVGEHGEFVWDDPVPPARTMAEYEAMVTALPRVGT